MDFKIGYRKEGQRLEGVVKFRDDIGFQETLDVRENAQEAQTGTLKYSKFIFGVLDLAVTDWPGKELGQDKYGFFMKLAYPSDVTKLFESIDKENKLTPEEEKNSMSPGGLVVPTPA